MFSSVKLQKRIETLQGCWHKKSRSGCLRDCESYFVASAQGDVDAIVELHEEDVAVLQPARDDVKSDKDTAVAFAIDAVAVDEADAWGFHEGGHFASVRLALAKGDAVGSCRYSVLTVLCGVADVLSVDGECAVASNFADTVAMKVDF